MFARLLVVVDADCDVRDGSEVLHRIVSHADLARDTFHQSLPGDDSHHAAALAGQAEMLCIDATRKLPTEHNFPWPAQLATADIHIVGAMAALWESLRGE
jgi:4-hydroxy-3-polyprenylbenzoate decarboxylase